MNASTVTSSLNVHICLKFPDPSSHLHKHYPTLYNRESQQYEYFCEKCGQTFWMDLTALMLHIESMHTKKGKTENVPPTTSVRPYLCEVCGKGYTQSSHLYQHLRFHKGNFQVDRF